MSGTPSTPVFPPSGRVNENADVSPVVIIPNTLVVDDVPYMHEFGKLREKLNNLNTILGVLQLHPDHRATIDLVNAILPKMTSAGDLSSIIQAVVCDSTAANAESTAVFLERTKFLGGHGGDLEDPFED